jgi:hypothetical protein
MSLTRSNRWWPDSVRSGGDGQSQTVRTELRHQVRTTHRGPLADPAADAIAGQQLGTGINDN